MNNTQEHSTPQCRLCSASQGQTIRADYVFGGRPEHKFWHCDTCDAIYLFPIPSVEEEQYFYEKEFEKFMASRSGDERDWSGAERHIQTNQDQVRRRWKFLEPHMQPGMELLEIGCSSGFMMDAFREFGMKCTGIEPSSVFIDYLKEKQYEVYSSLDEFRASAQARAFDVIVHFFVFEHIRDPYTFLRETVALLKPGGRLIAEIPCANDPLTSLYTIPAFEKFYWSIAHHYYYTPKSLAHVLDELGYSYRLLPEQRYDLSNHIVWMTEGKPGGQGRFNNVFSKQLVEQYKSDMKQRWQCDTVFLEVYKD